MLMFGVVDFGMELRSIPDEEDGRRTGSSLEKWRGYCHDLRPETTHSSSSSSMSPRVRVDLKADFGETSDDADSVFASTSSKGDSFPLGNDNLTFVQERQPRKRGVHDYGFLLNGDFNSSSQSEVGYLPAGVGVRRREEGDVPSGTTSPTNYDTRHQQSTTDDGSLITPWYKRFVNNNNNNINKRHNGKSNENRSSRSAVRPPVSLQILTERRKESVMNPSSVSHLSPKYTEEELIGKAFYI